MMYAPFMSDGVPYNKERAERRAKHEVATEII
jgi:hypothetical protein